MGPKLQRWVQRQGWDRASSCYERYWQAQLQPALVQVLSSANPQPGEHVVDVACGTGLATLPAASAVGSTGTVLGTDISPKTIAELAAKLTAKDVTNVDLACCDAQSLGAVGPFDVAICSLGLMYMPSPIGVIGELHRVLRPGGRIVISVWGERRNCGWAELFPIVEARVSSDVCPMFFMMGAPGILANSLDEVGFVDVEETRIHAELSYDSADEALGAAFLGGPVALAYSRFDAEQRRSAHAEYLASLAAFTDGSGYRVPGEFVVASARRSDE